MDKEYILSNVSDCSAEQLAEAIKMGLVTLSELKETDELDATKRRAIQKLLSASEAEQEAAWEAARNGGRATLEAFIAQNPTSPHVAEAHELIAQENRRRETQTFEHERILERIRLNPNTYSPTEIDNFIQNGTITRSELMNACGIPESAIDSVKNITPLELNLGATPDSIPDGYTEVYFWGGPGSGKTCALGAVLQMAEYKECLTIAPSSGYNYATQLKNIFSHDDIANDYLPAPSPVESTQYLPFSLRLPGERRSRSVSLIELSGEIYECFYYKINDWPLPTESHEIAFNSLNRFLSSKNRKIHFFFIDAGRDNRRGRGGLTQADYLNAAATYFQRHQVFDKTTDAIYIVLTKSDLLIDENGNHVPQEKRVEYAIKYLKNQRYGNFISALKFICKKYSINGGRLTVEPFSLGKVYFQQICNFDGTAAERLVNILLERIRPRVEDIINFFNA